MKLTVLGCAGSFPGPDSPCSSYLVQADGFGLLLDFGSGSMSGLLKHASVESVDAILLSHLHADHILDAVPYAVVRRYTPGVTYPPVPLYGPAGTPGRLAAAYGDSSLSDVYDIHELRVGNLHIGPFLVTLERMTHPLETYGVRLEQGGRVLAYSSDTAVNDGLVRLATGADLFLCEASYVDGEDNPPDLHLTAREAGEVASKAGVARLVLTHLVIPWGNTPASAATAAGSAYSGPIEVTYPGAVYDI